MPTLIDLLDQYLFSNAPGLVARAAIQHAWEYTTANSWDKLYLASLEDALSEELPHLSAYSGPGTKRPGRPELAQVLAADLGEAGATLATLDQSSRAFLTELARTMQSQRLITINHHNLFTDEYRQILLNLFDHAHTRFKSVLTRSEAAYSAALNTATDNDPILLASISTYLERQFGVRLDTLNRNLPPQPPVRVTGPIADEPDSSIQAATIEPFAVTAPESLQEDVSLEPLNEITPPLESGAPDASPPPQTSESYPIAWESTNEFAAPRGGEGIGEGLPTTLSEQPIDNLPTDSSQNVDNVNADSDTFSPPTSWQGDALTPAPHLAPILPPAAQNLSGAAAVGGLAFAEIGGVAETEPNSAANPPISNSRNMPNRLRVLVATPADVQTERRLLTELIRELDARARTRFGLELELINPNPAALEPGQSPVEQADIFVGIVWLQFGAESFVISDSGERYLAGTRSDFARALEQGSGRAEGWLRTVIYRSIRPPLDLLHMDIAEYARVQQFFERAGAYAGDDLVRVFADSSELINDARARLDAWIYNYAGDLAAALTEYGNNSAANGQIADSLTDYNQAISLYRELDRPELELALWLQVGALQQSTNNTASAEAFDTALRLARRIEDDPAAARALRSLGALDAANGAWQDALEKYRQAGTYLEPDDQEYRALLTDQVDAHEALGDQRRARFEYAPSVLEYESALTIARVLEENERQAALWNKLGALAAEHGEWNASLEAYDNALALTGPAQTEARLAILNEQANAHTQLALKARSAGDFQAAENAYQSALNVNARGSGDRQQRVALFTALGVLAAERAEWERGIEANEQALALLDSPEDAETRRALMSSQARAYTELGAQRAERGELSPASSAYRDALSLYQELDATSEQGIVLAHLGAISVRQQEWSEANAYLVEALSRLEGSANAELRAQALKHQTTALENIGDERRARNEWGQAEIAYVQARGNLEHLGMSDSAGPLLYRLGVVTAAQSRLPEALAYFQQARVRLGGDANAETRIASLRAQSDALHRFADMYRGAGDFQAAEGHYRQQLELAEELQDETLEADAYHSLGLTAADQGQWDNAVDLYDLALARLQTPEQETVRAFVQRHQLAALEKIGERERTAHQLAQAELAYRSALTLAQTLGEKENEADLLSTLGLISIEHENWDEALVDLRRALGIYNLLPAAPNKPKVIFAIGRAQRGQKQAHLRDTLEQAEAARDAAMFVTAAELARELGDSHNAAVAAQALGNLAAEQTDWDKALVHYDEALVGLAGSDDAPRRESILRAQLNARRERSIVAQSNAQWGAADADLFVALDLARELKDSNTQGDLVYRRGQVAAGQSRWNEAIDLYSEALNRFDEGNPERVMVERAQAEAYQSLGDSERESQNWPGAEAAYIQALALRQTLDDKLPQVALFAALGDVAMRQSRWNDAIIQLGSAQTTATELGQAERAAELDSEIQLASQALKRQEQETIERRGDAFRSSRAFALAQTEYEGALELAQELEDRSGQAELHAKLGFIATETGALETAVEHYRIAAGFYDTPENAGQRNALVELQAQALQEMGNRAGNNGAWTEAFGLYSQAVALLDAPSQENHRNEIVQLQAVTCQNLGDQYTSTREWADALDQYRRAAGLYAIVGAAQQGRAVRERQAKVLTEQAREAQQAGEFVAAQQLYAESISHLSELQSTEDLHQARAEQLISYRAAGIAAAEAKQSGSARRQYRQALGIAEELNDLAAQADLYHRLGQLAAQQSDWSAALLSYQYALERTGQDSELERRVRADQLIAYKELGTSQRIAGELDGAESSYLRAYTNAQSLDNASGASELAFLLGTLAADRENWESALGYYDQALASLSPADVARNEIQPYRAFAYQQLGDTQRANGQFAAAASAYANATNIADEIGDQARQGQLLYRFGLLEAAQGRWEPALDAYARAERRVGTSDPETADLIQRDAAFAGQALKREHLAAQLDHASAERANGAWDDAATAYRGAMALANDLGETELRDSIRRDLVTLYAEKGYALGLSEWWDESRDAYRESQELAQEYGFSDDVAKRQDDLLALVAASAANAEKLQTEQDWDAAQHAYDRTLRFAQEFGDTNAHAIALVGLGSIAQHRAQWQESKAYYEQARPLLVEVENASALVTLDTGLGQVQDVLDRQAQQANALASAEQAQSEGRFDDAQEQYRAAFGLAHGLQDSHAASAIAAALVAASAAKAHALRAQGQWTESERAYREALGVAREFEDPSAIQARQSDLVALTRERAEKLRTLESPQETEAAYRHALDVAQEFDDAETAGGIRASLVELAGEQAAAARLDADPESAESAYRRAIQVAQEFDRGEVVQEHKLGLIALAAASAQALQNQGRWQESENAYRHALEVAQEFDDGEAVRARRTDLIALATAHAEALRGEADWEASEDAYRHALKLANEFDDGEAVKARQSDLIALATAHANELRARADWEASEDAYRHALELANEFDDGKAVKARQSDLIALATAHAEALRVENDWTGSEAARRHAVELTREFQNAEALGTQQAELIALATAQAVELRRADDWAGSEQAYRHALELAQEFADTEAIRARQVDLIALATARAAELRDAKELAESETAYRHALELAQEFGDTEAIRARQVDLIALATARAAELRDANDWAGSETAYRHALGLANEFGDVDATRARQSDLINLATARANESQSRNDWDASAREYRYALALAQEFKDAEAIKARRNDLVLLADNRAQSLQTTADFRTNENAYREALAVAQEFQDTEAIQTLHAKIIALATAQAVLHRETQSREQAALALEHQLQVAQEFGVLEAQADALYELGQDARAADDLPSARNYYLTAAQTYEQAEAHQGTAKAQHALREVETILGHQSRLQTALSTAETARAGGRALEAEQAYREALVETEALNDVPTRAVALTALAALAFDQGEWQKSLDNYAAAAPLYESLQDPRRVAEIAQEQARATRRLRMAQRDEARLRGDQAVQAANLSRADNAYQEGLALARELDDTASSGAFEMSLGQVATAEQRLDDAAKWYDAAAISFAQAQQSAQRTTARTQLLTTYTALGDKHSAERSWDLAHSSYERASELAAEIAPPPQLAYLLARLGFVATQRNELRNAIDYLDRGLATLGADDLNNQRGLILEQRAQVWQELGDSEMDANNLTAAEFAYERALADARTLRDEMGAAQILHSLGLVRGAQEHWPSALQAHEESFALVQGADIPDAKLSILASLAEAKAKVGDANAARQDYQTALEIAQSLSDTQNIAEIEFALGEIAMGQEHWQEALTHYDAARPGLVELDDTERISQMDRQQATGYARLGEIWYGEGQWAESEIAFTQALELDSSTGRTDRDGVLYHRRGNAAAAQTRYADAIADYDRASVALADDDLELRDRTIAQLAFALQQQGKRAADAGDLNLTEIAFTRALKMAEASGNLEQVADLWYRLGLVYRAQARHDEALAAFRRAYEYDRIDGNAILKTVVADALAERLLQRGLGALETNSYAAADAELDQALHLARQAENPQLIGSTLEALGNSAAAQGDATGAIDYLAAAGKTFASIEDTERWRVVSQKQATLLRRLAADQLDANEFADAENLYRRTTLLQQAAGDTSNQAEMHLGLGQALLAQARFAEALDEFELADAAFVPGAAERSDLLDAYATALEAHGAQALALTDLDRAESDLTRAAKYRDELGQRTRAGLDWQQLADIAAEKREFAAAVRANEQALERLDTTETTDVRNAVLQQQAQILSLVGDDQKQAGDYAAASETYRHALAIVEEQGDLELMAQLRLLLGSLAEAQEHWEQAQTEYTHALDVYDELNQPEAQAATWTRLGDMHRQSTQFDHATEAFERARELYKKLGDHRQEGAMWVRLGHVEGDRAEWDRALDQYQAALHLYNEHGVRSAKPEAYRALERAVRNAKLVAADQAAAQGDAELEAQSFVAAEDCYRDAFDLYQEADEPMQLAQMHHQLGVALDAQEKWEEALTEYRAALMGFERVGLTQAQVSVLANIGDVESKRQNWNDSEASYRQALALLEPASDPARAAALLNSLGTVREAQGDWESALEHYQEAVAAYETLELEQARQEAAANMERARRGAQERAEQEQLARLEQARAEGDLAEAGEILNTLGLMAAEDGRWTRALDYYREAVADFEQLAAESDSELVWRTAQGTVLNNIGDASQQIGAWNDADYAYTRALRLAHELGDRESEAILLSNLGVAAQAQSQLPRALEFNLRALESFTELGDETPRADLLERVGDLQQQLDQKTAAEASYRQALDLARQANESDRIGRLLKQLGILAAGRGAAREALEYYQEALARSPGNENTREQQDLMMRQGALYVRTGQLDEADRTHQAALELAIAHADEPAQATLHTRLGESAIARQNWQTAIQEYQAALALNEKFGSPEQQLRALMQIGEAHTALEQPTQADQAYSSALELAQVETANVRALWLARAGIAEKQNRWQDASEYLENALAVSEPTRDAETQVNLLLRRGDAAMHAHNWTAADTSINDAMELANSSDLAVLYGWGMNRLGLLSQAQRNWNDALENYQEAIEIFRVNEQPLGEALVLNNIARLKLETNDPNQADLFAQAALAIAQAFGSDREASYSLYTRGLASLEAQDLEPAMRFLNQAIATDPENWAAQLQLGNTLLANGNVTEATQQAEAGLGQFPDWELGAQTQLTIASLSLEDNRPFKANLKRTRALLKTATDRRNVSQEMLDAVETVLRALEGNAENALEDLKAAASKPALPIALEAQRFIKTALWALAKSPRRVKGKQVLVSYFAVPKAASRKGKRRGAAAAKTADASQTGNDSPQTDENPGPVSDSGDQGTE